MSAHHTADEAAPRTRFRLLGPLEAVCGRQTLPLGGLRRRAVLAYLLLHPNEVVSVSRLVQALWGSEAPASARKVCQNSVWQLRRTLQDPGGGEGPADARLLTREPGYLLETDPALIDVSRFRELAGTGRAELAAGYPGAAASAWRQALGLWSGPVLADLTENEIHWPECEAVDNARLDVLESCFQAELLLGRHEALLPELTMTARAHPRREKFLQQLMLALYRSGRQTEALAAYDHARAELARDLGLEPGRELGALRQAILTQDTAALDGFQSGTPARDLPTLGPTGRRSHLRAVPEMPWDTADGPAPATRTVGTVVERRDVTVAVLRLAFRPVDSQWDPEDLDTLAAATDEVLRREAGRYGGTVADRAATTWTVVFGTHRMRDDDVRNAVLLCLEMRRRMPELTGGLPSVGLQAAVEAGEALVRACGAVPPEVMGAVLERCRLTLPSTDRQEVRVGAEAHAVVREDFFTFRPSRGIRDTWTVEGVRSVPAPTGPALVGRDREKAALRNVRDAAPDRPLPVMTLVTGIAGMGKSALLQDLAAHRPDGPSRHRRLVVEAVARAADQNGLAVIARNLIACCDLTPQDTLDQVTDKVRSTVRRIARTAHEAAWLEKRLQAAFLRTGENCGHTDGQETGEAWWRFLGRLAAERPVLVLADDLDTADEELLDRLDRLLAAPDPSPGLQVIACASPALLRRRPAWFRTGPAITHLRLLPLADQVIENQIRRLLGFLGVTSGATASGLGHALEEACAIAVFLSAGNPGFASELVHCALRRAHENFFGTADRPALLLPVRSRHMLGARLDELPTAARSVLVDAAFVGERLWSGAVAALRQRDETGIGAALDDLVWRGVLARTAHSSVPGETEYQFVEPLLRYVAVSRIPRAGRERKQVQLAEWRRRNREHDDESCVTGSDHDPVGERLRHFHALFAKAVAEREQRET
ncbi:DNA-binding SARP family transcriptional activator [Streptomyces aurantiacus]|uniref:BTAD domain-containing putative transcriptional regulator n=1 Tax=Streptomyces aurantiacus TaxID=47760 RepID=UPI002791E285|nr:BTAD domain-containing putative transcriptional regulator [Streptomyces aurantiacus]MDQ0779959.1 DNA-binding SARP family transcriptional activator [Streptomyces aurantiacus]